MDIIISAVNANELDEFIPVSGKWHVKDKSDADCIFDVEQSIVNWMNAPYSIKVSVFHADGRQINCELPWQGTFLATRKY
jgi:hypothetical protein